MLFLSYFLQILSFIGKNSRSVKFLIRIIYRGHISFLSRLPRANRNLKQHNMSNKLQNLLDCAIRDHQNLKEKSGYEIGGRVYDNYVSKEAFEIEKGEMKPLIREQFDGAPGGELKERRVRRGVYPPKMACFGSSSRFVVNLLKTDEGVCFEASLPTRVGNSANLDARKKLENKEVFVEAKCREIYNPHRKIEIKDVYKGVYDDLSEFFSYDCFESSKEGYFKCTFKVGEQEILHFDLKQLICHFLAIAAAILEKKCKPDIHFIYLIFSPSEVRKELGAEWGKMKAVYDKTLKEIAQFDMEKLFERIYLFQKENLVRREVKIKYGGEYTFTFDVANQWFALFKDLSAAPSVK